MKAVIDDLQAQLAAKEEAEGQHGTDGRSTIDAVHSEQRYKELETR